MKPYSKNHGEAHGTKYARKSKKIHARDVAERIHRKRARQVSKKEINTLEIAS
jgi:hypothetical protein